MYNYKVYSLYDLKNNNIREMYTYVRRHPVCLKNRSADIPDCIDPFKINLKSKKERVKYTYAYYICIILSTHLFLMTQ